MALITSVILLRAPPLHAGPLFAFGLLHSPSGQATISLDKNGHVELRAMDLPQFMLNDELLKPDLVGCGGELTDSDVTTGVSGSLTGPQSFNETRAVDVTFNCPVERTIESLKLEGLFLGGAQSTLVGARVYDTASQTLVSSADVTIEGGGSNLTVTIPICAALEPGRDYRIGFYVETSPLFKATGILFEPDVFPYLEDQLVFQVNSAHAFPGDTFPANMNIFTPQMTIRTSDEVTCEPDCPWDCGGDDNGDVGIVDFLALLAQWGGAGSCDFNGGGVGIVDFLELLANWGPCP